MLRNQVLALLAIPVLSALIAGGTQAHAVRAKVVRYKDLKLAQNSSTLETISRSKISADNGDQFTLKPLSAMLTVFTDRGLDEYADTYGLNFGGSLLYEFQTNRVFGIELAYSSILKRPDGELLRSYDSNSDRFGFGDTKFSFTIPELWKSENYRLAWLSKLTLPTSEVSRRASMQAEVSTEMQLEVKLTGWFALQPVSGMYYRQHQFDDADVAGTLVNSPFGIKYGLQSTLSPTQWLSLTALFSETQRLDYENRVKAIQTLSTTGTVSFSNKIKGFVSYLWRDEVITNDKAFSDDKANVSAGLISIF